MQSRNESEITLEMIEAEISVIEAEIQQWDLVRNSLELLIGLEFAGPVVPFD